MRFLSCHKENVVKQLLPLTLAALCLTAPASAQITSFQHIVLVIQENRTPDEMFQGLCTTPAACSTQPSSGQYDIQTAAWLDKTSSTRTTNPKAVPFGLGWDMLHAHAAFVTECDTNMFGACAMDGAAHAICLPYSQQCPTKAAYSYVDNSTGSVQPYLDIAKAYGWANYMFQTNQGPSFSAHEFLFSGTSSPSAADDHAGIYVAGEGTIVGCNSPPTTVVPLINPQGVEFTRIYPCFEYKTLTDFLEAKGKTWRYYGSTVGTYKGPTPDGIWIAPNSINHICVAVNQKCTGPEWTANLEFTQSAVLSDIINCNLRGVSWVIPNWYDSDHSGTPKNVGGPSWVASIVNAVGNSPCTNKDGSSYWSSTAIIVVWDDWGGWYDHEQPKIEPFPQGGFQMGFRVPMLVVSAYTGPGTISNKREDFGSVLRFIEHNFGIMEGALTFADARGGTSDLSEYFSLGQPARKFQAISAPLSLKYFLTKKPSFLPVDND